MAVAESCAEESDDDIESDRSGMEIWEGPQPSYSMFAALVMYGSDP